MTSSFSLFYQSSHRICRSRELYGKPSMQNLSVQQYHERNKQAKFYIEQVNPPPLWWYTIPHCVFRNNDYSLNYWTKNKHILKSVIYQITKIHDYVNKWFFTSITLEIFLWSPFHYLTNSNEVTATKGNALINTLLGICIYKG